MRRHIKSLLPPVRETQMTHTFVNSTWLITVANVVKLWRVRDTQMTDYVREFHMIDYIGNFDLPCTQSHDSSSSWHLDDTLRSWTPHGWLLRNPIWFVQQIAGTKSPMRRINHAEFTNIMSHLSYTNSMSHVIEDHSYFDRVVTIKQMKIHLFVTNSTWVIYRKYHKYNESRTLSESSRICHELKVSDLPQKHECNESRT